MIVWVDIETDGLNERGGHLLEVALVVTSDQLWELNSMSVVIKPRISLDEVVERMDPYVRNMHTRNGLIEDVRKTEISLAAAEAKLVNFMQTLFANEPLIPSERCLNCGLAKRQHVTEVDNSQFICADNKAFVMKMDSAIKHTPLAGSSVEFDRRWLREHMPGFERQFSHRSLDVSVVTELAKMWSPEVFALRPKGNDAAHRALADIHESIKYLRWYREVQFIGGASNGFETVVGKLRESGLQVHR